MIFQSKGYYTFFNFNPATGQLIGMLDNGTIYTDFRDITRMTSWSSHVCDIS